VSANYIQQYTQFLCIFLKAGFYPILIVDKMTFIDCIKMFCTIFITTSGSFIHFYRLFGFLIFLYFTLMMITVATEACCWWIRGM